MKHKLANYKSQTLHYWECTVISFVWIYKDYVKMYDKWVIKAVNCNTAPLRLVEPALQTNYPINLMKRAYAMVFNTQTNARRQEKPAGLRPESFPLSGCMPAVCHHFSTLTVVLTCTLDSIYQSIKWFSEVTK